VRRIAGEQIGKTLSELDDPQLGQHETVHQVRKRCKKLRGLLRIVRPQCEETYHFENGQFRDASKQLSGVRDAESVCECFDLLIDHFREEIDVTSFQTAEYALRERRETIADECIDLDKRLAKFREAMEEARKRVSTWPFGRKGFSAVNDGLKKTYSRGRDAMDEAYETPSAERFHEWRKRVKYHWYHTRLLRNTWKPVQKKWRNECKQLADHLGDMHDLAVLRRTLLDEPERYGSAEELETLTGLIDAFAGELADKAQRIGERVFCEKPKRLVRRWKRYWKVWRRSTQSPELKSAERVVVTV
jgi:CHAD domain-containing protein